MIMNNIPFVSGMIHPSWEEFLNDKSVIKELENIKQSIGDEFFPIEENVLRFLSLNLDTLNYIIVGMEPYPSVYDKFDEEKQIYVQTPVATGRSFEIANVSSWSQKYKQASLRNILKTIYFSETGQEKSLYEIQKEIMEETFYILPPHEWFDDMEKQGVMFLNATLTVKPFEPDSHTELWESFIQKLIAYIENKNPEVEWILWGKKAWYRFYPEINNPCILGYHPRVQGFIKENCFKYMPNVNWTGIKNKEKRETFYEKNQI